MGHTHDGGVVGGLHEGAEQEVARDHLVAHVGGDDQTA